MLTNRTPEAHAVGARGVSEIRQRGPVRATERGQGDHHLPGVRRRRGVGRRGVRSGERTALCQFDRDGVDGGPGGNRERNVRPAVVSDAVRCLPSRRSRRRAAADSRRWRISASRRKATEVGAVIRQGAGRMPAFPNLSRQAVDAAGAVCDERGRQGDGEQGAVADRSEIPLHGISQVRGSGRISGDGAAMGDAERDQFEYRRVRVEDPVRASIPNWWRRA